MNIKCLLLTLLIPLVGCVPYDSYAQNYYSSGVYSNVPGNASITIIENRPVPNFGYQRYPDYRGGYYLNAPPIYYNNNNYYNNGNRWDRRGDNWNRRDYDRRLDRNNKNFNDRWDRTEKNPRYRPPVQVTPGPRDPNKCTRMGCATPR